MSKIFSWGPFLRLRSNFFPLCTNIEIWKMVFFLLLVCFVFFCTHGKLWLFQKIGGFFIKALISEFGTDHIYNADTFNELTPRSNDTSYLSGASKAVYEGMLAGDPNATWLMQGWLFQDTSFWKPPQIKALLQGNKVAIVLFKRGIYIKWHEHCTYDKKTWKARLSDRT